MKRLARECDTVRVVSNQHGTPTAAGDVAGALLAIMPLLQEWNVFGTFHLTNAGRTTWHGFAEAIFAGLANHGRRVPRLEAIITKAYPTAAKRSALSVLECQKISDVYGIRLRPWRDALNATLDGLLANQMERGEA